jgi:hypothetical protein
MTHGASPTTRVVCPWPVVSSGPGQKLHLPVPVPVKNSIRLYRLNLPHHLHRRSGKVSAQMPCLTPGCSDDIRDRAVTFLRVLLFGAAAVALENLALRHQLLVLQRSVSRPRLSGGDRVFWVWLSRLWAAWRASLVIVQPATVLAWHRRGFQRYWHRKSRAKPVGRPRLAPELRQLIRQMARRGAAGAFGPNSPCSATRSPS